MFINISRKIFSSVRVSVLRVRIVRNEKIFIISKLCMINKTTLYLFKQNLKQNIYTKKYLCETFSSFFLLVLKLSGQGDADLIATCADTNNILLLKVMTSI